MLSIPIETTDADIGFPLEISSPRAPDPFMIRSLMREMLILGPFTFTGIQTTGTSTWEADGVDAVKLYRWVTP